MAVGLSVVVLAGATGWVLRPVMAQVPVAQPKAPPPAAGETRAEPKGDGVDETPSLLMNQRHEAALSEWESRFKEYQAGRGTLDIALESARRILESGLALKDKPVGIAYLLNRV